MKRYSKKKIYQGKFPDIVLSREFSLIMAVFGCYQGKFPDIVLSRESSLIIPVLDCYQGKVPDNQWLALLIVKVRYINGR